MPADARKGTRPWRPPSSPAPAPASATRPRSIWRGTATASSRACATSVRPARSAPAAAEERLPIEVVALDVTAPESVATAIAAVAAAGPIDVLVNNAGIGGASPLELTPEAEHRQMFETNYFGAVRCIQAVLPAMRDADAARSSTSPRWPAAGRRRTRSPTPPPSGRSNASARRSPTRSAASASASSTSSPASS